MLELMKRGILVILSLCRWLAITTGWAVWEFDVCALCTETKHDHFAQRMGQA
jgi:hypothetical protein